MDTINHLTIDEIFEGIDTTIEMVTVELVDGEQVTIPKSQLEKLEMEQELYETGEFLY